MDDWSVAAGEPEVDVDAETRLLCFRRQCDEVELLEAVFCNSGEFLVHDELALALMRDCVHSGHLGDELRSRLGFSIQQSERVASGSEVKVELVFSLPQRYPLVLPVVFVRCPCLSRAASVELNKHLQEFVQKLAPDVVAVMDIVSWTKENINVLTQSDRADFVRDGGTAGASGNANRSAPSAKRAVGDVERLWLYSHHIYCNFKRKDIVAWAHDLQLTGFSLPGKPGVICVEGHGDDIDEYVQRLRSHSWKKLTIRDRQILPGAEQADKKFTDFREITFSSNGHTRDFKELFNFLQKKGLGGAFKILFGIDGQ